MMPATHPSLSRRVARLFASVNVCAQRRNPAHPGRLRETTDLHIWRPL